MEAPDRLDTLVESLIQKQRDKTVGSYYLFWGIFNIVGMSLFIFVWFHTTFWAIWIPLGVAIQTYTIRKKNQELGRKLWHESAIPHIWVAVFVALILLIWLFPFVLKLYAPLWIFPLTSFWVALGAFATGIHFRSRVFALCSSAFWIATVMYIVFPRESFWIFSGSCLLGLVIPGWISHRDERA